MSKSERRKLLEETLKGLNKTNKDIKKFAGFGNAKEELKTQQGTRLKTVQYSRKLLNGIPRRSSKAEPKWFPGSFPAKVLLQK